MKGRFGRWAVVVAVILMAASSWKWWSRPSASTPRVERASPAQAKFAAPASAHSPPPDPRAPPAIAPLPAANAIVPPPASAIIKTVVDTTPRAVDLMKVFRITNDPPGLAAEALGDLGDFSALLHPLATQSSSLEVLPPIPEYDTDAKTLVQNGLPFLAAPHNLLYLVENSATGEVVGSADFYPSNKQPGGYSRDSMGVSSPDGVYGIIVNGLRYLASLGTVQAGSYEPRYFRYGLYPSPGLAYALWLHSPSGDNDLVYPLPGGGIASGGPLPYGMQAKVYSADDFIAKLRSAYRTETARFHP